MPELLRNPRYDGLIVFLPDVSRLRSGDILLTFNAESENAKGSKQSIIIRRVTGGRFSHALICSVPPTMIEAIGTGVSTLSLARCFIHNLDNVRVLRYPNGEIAAKAASLAQMEIGRDYSIPKAISSVFSERTIRKINDEGIFCSALVSQVFSNAGAKEFLKTAVEKTTPATIERLDGMEDITSLVFREALAPNNVEQMCALDGDRIFSPSEWQTEINGRYARILIPFAQSIVAEYPDAKLTSPSTLFQLIQFIMHAIENAPEIEIKRRSSYDAAVGNLDIQAAELMSSGELANVFNEMMRADEVSDQRNLAESFEADPDIDKLAMQSYFETSKIQIDRRRAAIHGFTSWGVKRSKTLEAYIELESAVVTAMERRLSLIEEVLTRIA